MSASILLVDDSPADLEIHGTFLRNAQFRVFTANDTRSAMEIFMRETLDLVLLDFRMGETDGGILAFEMRRRRPAVKIAYLCGEPDAKMPLDYVDAVIGKSMNPSSILQHVQRLLGESSSKCA